MKYLKRLEQMLNAIAISFLSGASVIFPVRAAETIYFDYSVFGRSLSVSSLEAFAYDGTVDAELAPYLNVLSAESQQAFQQALNTPLSSLNSDIPEQVNDPFILSQLLYSPIGQSVLERFGQLIQTQGRQNGQHAIRAAIILAAADSNGLSLMNIIRQYPIDGVRLDLRRVLALYKAIDANIETTEELVRIATQQSEIAASTDPPLDYRNLPVLAETGQFTITTQSLTLVDNQRNRSYPVDLYQPNNLDEIEGPIPLMILSHGYGDSRTNSSAVAAAQNLAANGFVVAAIEHIGSNTAYQDDLIRGLTQESFDAVEFINRPLDIQFLLDTLEQQNEAEFQGRLQLERVGIIGHSFGGYTALAAAGATIDIDYLEDQCNLESEISPDNVNIALLLQCRALELAESPELIQQLTNGSLADDRIGLVFVLAPVSSLFGERGTTQIQIPVVITGGASDIATPVAREQLVTFQRLTTSEKYLYLGENLAHTPELTQLALEVTNPSHEIGDDELDQAIELFSNLIVSLAIAHGRVYLLGDESYRPYLTSTYVEAISVEPFDLHLLRSSPDGF
ncbi:MAG: alpha/beta hydrolase [Cyanobacteria bacterium J06627_8]